MQLYLDCDGVLADFDAGVRALLGMGPKAFQARYGLSRFWRALARRPDFYADLPLMADARELFDGVRHLDPIILTGLPRGDWAAPQKRRWVEAHFPGTPVITCMAALKREHCRPGDVLVDDTARAGIAWVQAGGCFVLHRSARQTLAELRRRFPELFTERPASAA